MEILEARFEALRQDGWKMAKPGPFMTHAGPLWTKREANGWVYGIWSMAQHLNPAGVVHGGLLQALMDHALSTVAWEAANRSACLTVQMNTQFYAAVPVDSLITARGTVARRTSSLFFVQGALTVAGEEVLAAQAVMKLVRL